MMASDHFIEIGRIKKPHGTSGRLIISIDPDLELDPKDPWFIFVEIHQRKIPFFVEEFQMKQDYIEVKLEDIDSPESAQQLTGNYVFMEQGDIRDEKSDSVTFRDLIGYTVNTDELHKLGVIEDVLERANQPLLKIVHGKDEILIPAVIEFIERIDKENNTIYLKLPGGLTELNA